jgi:hypothetical protein
MLDVQSYLRDLSCVFPLETVLEDLKNNYGISSKQSKIYPELYLFKYSQTQSPFREKIVRECRGLILNSQDNWSIVCYPFDKFFNLGEQPQLQKDFNWNNYRVYNKLDGSLVCFWYYKNKWNISTSGDPDSLGEINNSGRSFKDAVEPHLNYKLWIDNYVSRVLPEFSLSHLFLNTKNTYMYEFISVDNKNVVDYYRYNHDYVGINLIGIRDNNTLLEENLANSVSVFPSRRYMDLAKRDRDTMFYWQVVDSSNNDVWKQVDELNPIYGGEGYVLVDDSFNRIKVKSKSYVALHHLKHSWSLPSAIQVVLNGEVDEVANYFPEYREQLYQIESWLRTSIDRIEKIDIELANLSRKELALKIDELRDVIPFTSALFAKRDGVVIKDYIYSLSTKKIKEFYENTNDFSL